MALGFQENKLIRMETIIHLGGKKKYSYFYSVYRARRFVGRVDRLGISLGILLALPRFRRVGPVFLFDPGGLSSSRVGTGWLDGPGDGFPGMYGTRFRNIPNTKTTGCCLYNIISIWADLYDDCWSCPTFGDGMLKNHVVSYSERL